MSAGRTARLALVLLVATIAVVGWELSSQADDAAKQAAPAAAQPGDKELDGAVAKAREGRIDDALALIKEKAAKHPEWPAPHLILGRILFSLNQATAAHRALEQAAALAPEDPEVYLTLGAVALAEGRVSDARLNFDHCQGLFQAKRFVAAKESMLRRECAAGQASVAEAREDWKTTADRLNDWLALEPNGGRVRQRLGRALFMLGKSEDAFKELTRGVKDEPALEPAAVSMGLLYSRKGDVQKAEEWFDYAEKLEPKSVRVRLARAGWLLDQGRAKDAGREIDEAVKLDPASKEAQKLRAICAWHLRDLAGAEAILDPLHRDAPADSVVANLLALALLEQDDANKKKRGAQLADVNALQFPRSPEVQATLGWALFRSDQLEPAEQKLRAAVTGVATTPDIAYYLACVMNAKGRSDDAKKLLESVTKVPGAFAHRDDAAALLKKLAK
jgi:Flp pilus assembly protein TadD